MPELTWEKWNRSKGCRKWMDRTKFGKWSYTDIFYDAMSTLFYSESGKKGVVYKGDVLKEARKVVKKFNGNNREGFDDGDLEKLIGDGNFKYGSLGSIPLLIVEGPSKSDLEEEVYASAGGGILIEFNFYQHIKIANDLKWKKDNDGKSKLIWLTAATMLHEITHNHGFRHPKEVSYTGGSKYASTLPFVAEMAVCRVSPHWDYFKGLYDDGLWLTGNAKRTCGA